MMSANYMTSDKSHSSNRDMHTLSCNSNVPLPLMDLCIQYIVKNILIVESFIGLPAIIGQKIFEAAERIGTFRNQSTMESLRLFSSAYGEEVLSTLNIEGHYLGMNYYLDQLCQFNHLVTLNCSKCGLGDEHELLSYIGHLSSLKWLSLGDDGLSDFGIQKITAPFRMFGHGPKNLVFMDLSDNAEVGEKSLQYLASYPALQCVTVSGTTIKHPNTLVKTWTLVEKSNNFTGTHKLVSKGWAAGVVQAWMQAAVNRANKPIPVSNTSTFYSRKRKRTEVLEVHNSFCKNDVNKRFLNAVRCICNLTNEFVTPLTSKNVWKGGELDATVHHCEYLDSPNHIFHKYSKCASKSRGVIELGLSQTNSLPLRNNLRNGWTNCSGKPKLKLLHHHQDGVKSDRKLGVRNISTISSEMNDEELMRQYMTFVPPKDGKSKNLLDVLSSL
ncbi:hypothetical protein CHS0354_022406 [Potamilus streckersoni]|uniref:Leucine-rich repeat-containing protein 42 n=1 Tax=Potamilus streckersoni TaxID=2493646 RepID=A0AAE0SXR2_9BIVA|nr:hypothetical protein CHS0354_022406 [Potamilus streckersoni]